jgi:predicted enzyme related to lactoylglutathione lyase
MASVNYFELPADDLERARRFYAMFGFGYEQLTDEMAMLRASEGGMDGTLFRRGERAVPTIVITVDDLDRTLAEVLAHGGAQLGDVQQHGPTTKWVYIRDTENNVIGLHEEMPATPSPEH